MTTKVIKLKLMPHDLPEDRNDKEAVKQSWKAFKKLISDMQYQIMHVKNAVSNAHGIYVLSTKSGSKPDEKPKENLIYQSVLRSFLEKGEEKIISAQIANSNARSVKPLFSKTHGKDLWNGNRVIPSFRRDAAINMQYDKKGAGIENSNTSGSFKIVGRGIKISLLSKRIGDWRYDEQTCFTFPYYIPKDNSTKSILQRIDSGEYLPCSGTLYIKKNNVFLNITYKLPKNKVKTNWIEDRVLGVDIGIRNIAAMALNDHNKIKKIIEEEVSKELQNNRNKNQWRVKTLGRALRKDGGKRSGHGKIHKLKPLVNLKINDRDFQKTINHKISRIIVEFSKSVGARFIAVEDLSGICDRGKIPAKKLRRWAYYELQQMIAYKAEIYGITAILVDPAYTSKDCSMCGHRHKTIGNKIIKCKNCEHIEHRDLNAARNIAKRGLESIKNNKIKLIREAEPLGNVS